MSKVELVRSELIDIDYHVALRMPDGRVVTVLIPATDKGHWASWVDWSAVFGLNLVCEGHYS